MKIQRLLLLLLVIGVIVAAIVYLQSLKPAQVVVTHQPHLAMNNAVKDKRFPKATEIVSPTGFVNTAPLTLQQFVGKKVVLLDFWTYSCINCQRTLPYLNAWYEKYHDQGLEIVGIHTPEFEFEKDINNVKDAVARFGIKYPVVLDSDYGTWNAYKNHYWPHEYLIDVDGYVVHDNIGEGGYTETEGQIQYALQELHARLGSVAEMPSGTVHVQVEQANSQISPETYFGAARNDYLANGTIHQAGTQTFTLPSNVSLNALALSGQWNVNDEYATTALVGATVVYHYQAQKVFLVAGAQTPITVEVLRDGKPLTTERGKDVGPDGTVVIQEDRLYRLIEDSTGSGDHTIELRIKSPGLNIYTLTFG